MKHRSRSDLRLDPERSVEGLDWTVIYGGSGPVEVEIGIGKGKKEFDKRATIKDRDWQRDKARVIRVN